MADLINCVEFCKALADPTRQKILGMLMDEEKNVSEIVGGYSVCITERRVDVDSPVLNPRELRKYRRPGELMSALFR